MEKTFVHCQFCFQFNTNRLKINFKCTSAIFSAHLAADIEIRIIEFKLRTTFDRPLIWANRYANLYTFLEDMT